MSILDNYIYFVFFIKIIFIILAIINRYLKKQIPVEENIIKHVSSYYLSF